MKCKIGMTVNEVSKLASVSVRTLHYYDEIGLLCPEDMTDAGYRLYGERSIQRLQRILLLRELEFPLKAIREIMDSADIDTDKAMEQQIALLTEERDRLQKLIDLAKKIRKGEHTMDFKAFEKQDMGRYAAEAKERWGNTAAYKEQEKKTAGYGKAEWDGATKALMDCFAGFGAISSGDPADAEAQAMVKKLQDTITANFYNCTKQILAGLGPMYTGDDRFRENIDLMGGAGTADFAAAAIAEYCK